MENVFNNEAKRMNVDGRVDFVDALGTVQKIV